jgi:hypothetical protein
MGPDNMNPIAAGVSAANIIDDIPSESRLEPAEWGVALVE